MCGIIGYISLKNKRCEKETFVKSLKHLNKRGPDNSTVKYIGNVTLGHTRLSILDITSSSNQPMDFFDKYTIVFNGEIYNYIELKNELKLHGYKFTTTGDTEVILAAYDHWKEKCVEHFNGMWAFAVYNKIDNKIFCSRDRFGVKPLFYYHNKDFFVFSSEIKAILPFMEGTFFNYDVAIPFIARGITDFGSMTFFKDIYRLLPSHNLQLDIKKEKKKIYKYYEILKKDEDLKSSDIYDLLEDSIKLRLRSDVKIGTCLSGGLDSSCVAAIANKNYNGKLIAIHGKSTSKENDESDYAREVAKYLNIDLHIVEPKPHHFWDEMNNVIYRQEEPFGSTSIFMQYFVMKKSHELGCKVMLDGQGADEIFLGYESYLPFIYKEFKKNKNFDEKKFFDNLKLFRFNQNLILEEYSKDADFTKNWNMIKNGNFNEKYLNKEIFKKIYNHSAGFDFKLNLVFSKQLQALLRFEDKNSMSFSIEARTPYLDYRLVEKVINLKTSKKFKNGYLKHLLRESADAKKLLPTSIIYRYNKMGFEAPQNEWIDIYRDEMIFTINNSKILKNLFKKIDIRRDDFLWKLFCIAKWEEVYNVKP